MDESEIYLQLGRLVRQHRGRLGMSQEVLAREIELSRASVANIESGRQHIPLHHLFRLARALEVKPEALLPFSEAEGGAVGTVKISATQALSEQEHRSVARIVGSVDPQAKQRER